MPEQNPKSNKNQAEDEHTRVMPELIVGVDNSDSVGDLSGEITGEGGSGAHTQSSVSLLHKTLANGKYQVNRELGRGGMSVVYAATDLSLGRTVAVKVMLAEYALEAGHEAIMRFQLEARSVAKLSHPHIISIYEYGLLEDGVPFIVMDYIVGVSLADEMQAHGLMSEERVLEIIKQSAEALRHSHAQGIVHRDIKPSNLLLTKGDDGEDFVRVVDFGIAKMQSEDPTGKLTRTGQVFGSPLYMSPEQCEGLVADSRSDIYSLGCVAYELVTGRPPHIGKNVVETMHRKMTVPPAPFTSAPGGQIKSKKNVVDPQLQHAQFKLAFQKVILKMLAANPAERYQSADELLSDIKQVKKSAPVRATQDDLAKPNIVLPQAVTKSPQPMQKKMMSVVKSILVICGVLLAGFVALVVYDVAVDISHHAHSTTPNNNAQKNDTASTNDTAGSGDDKDNTVASNDTFASNVGAFPQTETESESRPAPMGAPSNDQLKMWRQSETAGHSDFLNNKLDEAQSNFARAREIAGQIKNSYQDLAMDVALCDAIDVASVKGNVHADEDLWAKYQHAIEGRRAQNTSVDLPLVQTMDTLSLSYKSGEAPQPDVVDSLVTTTFQRVKVLFADERFGDAERLLRGIVPILQQRQKEDGSLAHAYHTLAQIRATEGKWRDALKYANLACDASQGQDRILKSNRVQALLFKGWAQAGLGDSPEDSYNEALSVNADLGPQANLSSLAVIKRLSQYYESKKKTDEARATAEKGIKLAEEGEFNKKVESRRLENLAYFYSVLGHYDDAIKTALKGLEIEDCTLPRQDYQVEQQLKNLSHYYKENNQEDLADYSRARADAMDVRLRKYDEIFKASGF